MGEVVFKGGGFVVGCWFCAKYGGGWLRQLL